MRLKLINGVFPAAAKLLVLLVLGVNLSASKPKSFRSLDIEWKATIQGDTLPGGAFTIQIALTLQPGCAEYAYLLQNDSNMRAHFSRNGQDSKLLEVFDTVYAHPSANIRILSNAARRIRLAPGKTEYLDLSGTRTDSSESSIRIKLLSFARIVQTDSVPRLAYSGSNSFEVRFSQLTSPRQTRSEANSSCPQMKIAPLPPPSPSGPRGTIKPAPKSIPPR